MHDIDVPETIESISPQWITAALRGLWPEIEVTEVTTEPIGVGVGQMSVLARLTLQYRGVTDAPGKLVVKLHSSHPDVQALCHHYHIYEREANFYLRLADDVPLRTPNVYFAKHVDGKRLVILMEDMSAWSTPDQLTGPTLTQADLAVRQLARLTAAFWNSPRLETESSWLPDWNSDYMRAADHYRASVPEFLKRFGEVLPEGGTDAVKAIAEGYDKLADVLNTGIRVLTHYDYRIENMFFSDSDPNFFCLVDWAMPMRSRPGFDFAYLMGTSIPVRMRREHGEHFRNHFFACLESEGIQNYSRADLDLDIALNSMKMTGIPVVAGAAADISVQRNVKLFESISSRTFCSILDGGFLDALPR